MDLTIERIEELERLEKEATPGPWVEGYGFDIYRAVADANGVLHTTEDEVGILDHVEYLVALRNSAPSLLAAARSWVERRDIPANHSRCGEKLMHQQDRIAALEKENARLRECMTMEERSDFELEELNGKLIDMADVLKKENAELKEQRNEAIIKGNRATERSNRLTALVREAIPAWKACRALARGGTKFEDWLNRAEEEVGK